MKIEDITLPNLGFELFNKEDFEEVRKNRQVVGVPSRLFLSSEDLLIGYGFSACQAIALIDLQERRGAMLHNHPEDCPSDYLIEFNREKGRLIDPRKYFSNLERVRAFHVYHESNHSYPISWVEGPLKKIGIQKIANIPIKSSVPGKNYWMDVALDVKNPALYVIPTDFPEGIKLKIREGGENGS